MLFTAAKFPFILHMVVETAAAASFIFRPASQVPRTANTVTPGSECAKIVQEADLILQSFGGALLATNLVALAMVLREGPTDDVSRAVALALATYHPWPAYRAIVRIRREGKARQEQPVGTVKAASPFGGPPVHLAVHVLCLASLLYSGFYGSGE